MNEDSRIDLLAILQKSLGRALFLYSFISEVLLSDVGALHIRKFFKVDHNIVRFRFFLE